MRYPSRHEFQRQTFPISIKTNRKEFSATLTSGAACLLQDTGSNVSIEVSKGTRAVIKQHVHTNQEALGFATSSNECIVSPVVTVHTMEIISTIMPTKLKDQPIKLEPSSPKEEHSDEHQSIKVEPLNQREAGHIDDDQSMKQEPLFLEEAGDTDDDGDDESMKLEPLSPEEATNTDDDQSMEHEHLSPKEAGGPEGVSSMKLWPLFPKKAGDTDDDHSMKSEPLSPEEAEQLSKFDPLPPHIFGDSDQRFVKLETKSFKETDEQLEKFNALPLDGTETEYNVVPQTENYTIKDEKNDVQEAHCSYMYTEPPKHVIHKNVDQESFYKFKLTIPHYVEGKNLVDLIQVKWGNIQGKLREIRKGKPDKFEPYCEVYSDHVVVYADHFCDVVCTCPEKVCASKLLAFPFGQIYSEPGRMDNHIKMKTYLCSHLYQDKSLKKVSINVKYFIF